MPSNKTRLIATECDTRLQADDRHVLNLNEAQGQSGISRALNWHKHFDTAVTAL